METTVFLEAAITSAAHPSKLESSTSEAPPKAADEIATAVGSLSGRRRRLGAWEVGTKHMGAPKGWSLLQSVVESW